MGDARVAVGVPGKRDDLDARQKRAGANRLESAQLARRAQALADVTPDAAPALGCPRLIGDRVAGALKRQSSGARVSAPADMVLVEMCEEDDVDGVRGNTDGREALGQRSLRLQPLARHAARGPDARVDEQRVAGRLHQIRVDRQTPAARGTDGLGMPGRPALPAPLRHTAEGVGEAARVVGHRVEQRVDGDATIQLDATREEHGRVSRRTSPARPPADLPTPTWFACSGP